MATGHLGVLVVPAKQCDTTLSTNCERALATVSSVILSDFEAYAHVAPTLTRATARSWSCNLTVEQCTQCACGDDDDDDDIDAVTRRDETRRPTPPRESPLSHMVPFHALTPAGFRTKTKRRSAWASQSAFLSHEREKAALPVARFARPPSRG